MKREIEIKYPDEYFFITLAIVILHIAYFCIDYYATEKVAYRQILQQDEKKEINRASIWQFDK